MAKRIIALLLCLVTILSLLPLVSAQETTVDRGATKASNFVGYPSVFVVEDDYRISFLTNTNGMAWVEIGGVAYEDTTAGIMDWETKFHGITVPQSVLDSAKSYKICFRPLSERPANNPAPGATQSKTYSFNPVLPGEDPVLLCVSDQHNNNTGAVAVSKYANYDALVFGGDYTASINTEAVAQDFLKYSGEISMGTKPVIYPRGNHEIRGNYTHWIDGVVPASSTNKSYFEFVMGDVYGIVMDCGGSYADNYTDIADTIDYEPYRVEQTRWLEQVYTKGTWRQYSKRIIVSHVPFVTQANFTSIFKDWTNILNRMDMSVCISGHTHNFTFYTPTHGSVKTAPNFPTFTMTKYAKDPYVYTGGYLTLGDENFTLKQVDSASLSVLSTHTIANKTYGITPEPSTKFETAVAPMPSRTVSAGSASVPSVASPFSAHPTVFVVEDHYVISFLTTENGMGWVEIGGQKYKDSTMGVMDWESRIHSVTVPQSILNSAKTYKICFQSMSERKAYTPVHGETKSKTYPFTPAPPAPTYLCMSEQLNDNTNAMKVSKYKNWDVFVCGGKYMKAANTENNRYYLLTLCGETAQGTKPTIFTRGNRELRGFGAHDVIHSMGTSTTGDAYFYFTQPNIFGIVLDTGEYGADSLAQFGDTVRFQKYREEQAQWLRKILAEGKWKDYDNRVVICHIPFTTYTDGSMKAVFKEWTDILNQMGVTLMIAGHVNKYAYHPVGDAANVSGPNFPMLTMSDAPENGSTLYSGTYVTFNGRTFTTENVSNTLAVREKKTVINPLYVDKGDLVSNYSPTNDQNVLYFGFGNTPDDVQRYTTNPVYANANYDTNGVIRTSNFYKGGNSNYDLPTGTGMGFDYNEGTVYSNITGPYASTSTDPTYTGNVSRRFVFGETNDTKDSVGSLKYSPKNAEVFQVRFKLHNVKLRSNIPASERARIVSLQYYKDSATSATRNANSYGGAFVNDKYMVVTLDLDSNFKSATTITKFWVEFHGFFKNDESADASITLDYVYIGPRATMPTKDDGYLLFDFTNSAAAQYRYSGEAYGANYDLAANWSFNDSRSSMPEIINGAMTATCKQAGHAWFETKNGKTSAPAMAYVPSGEEYVQVRLRFHNLERVATNEAGRVTIFFFDASNHVDATARSATFSIPNEDLATNGEWFTYHFKIGDQLKGLAKSDSVRITLSNIYSSVGTGTVEIDYLYIGDDDKMPTPHNYSEVVTPPTCIEHGYTTFTCADCGKILVGNETEAGVHDYETVETAPTCTESGLAVHTCVTCGHVSEEILAPMGHNTEYRDSVQPTCTTDGLLDHFSCGACGGYFADIEGSVAVTQEELRIEKLGHSYASETNEPTCTTEGVTVYTCTACGDSYEERTDALGHSYDIVVTDPDCTHDGYTTYTCSVCDDTYITDEIDALGHSEIIDEAVAPTCTEGGLTEGAHCDACGEVLVAQQAIAANGHSYDEGKITVEPICGTNGVMTYTCLICGAEKTETIVGTAHVSMYVAAIAPTCTEDGLEAHYKCIHCGKTFIDEKCAYPIPIDFMVITALGHAYDSVVTEPTCTDDGYTSYTCFACGDSYTADEVKANGHSYTYTNNGENHTVGCANCDDSATEDHTYVDGKCICGANEPTEQFVETLKPSMSIVVGAEMSVAFTVNQSMVSKYESFYLVVEKDMVGAETKTVTFGYGEGQTALTPMPNATNPFLHNASFTGLTAKEMGDEIRATLYCVDAEGNIFYGPTQTDSVKDYLLRGLDLATSTPEKKTMYVDMLRYGAVAQTYFDYDTDNLVADDLTEEHLTYATTVIPEAVDGSKAEGGHGTLNTSVVLKARVTLTLSHLKPGANLANMKFIVKDALDGTVIKELPAYNLNPVMIAADFDDVGAKQMRRLITVTLYDGDTAITDTVTWSVESYVAKTRATSTDAGQIDLVNAMLTYGDAVAAYMATQ